MSFEKEQGDIAVIGLAVMGQNLILNMADKGFNVVAYNRTQSKVADFLAGEAASKSIAGASDIDEMLGLLKSPRKIMLMVKAGEVVDSLIQQLIPKLYAGDIIIDGGNSDFRDTSRRVDEATAKGIHYLGVGVSGGEEGARYGPSMMPGGNEKAWQHVKPIFQAIAAKTESGEVCCDWVGRGGAGHFVKMVHNGIEYGDMQLIAETYAFMKNALQMNHDDMHKVFSQWQKGSLNSYLIEITTDILGYRENDEVLLEKILDVAGQKGTGKLTSINALESGIPLTLITESVFARFLSSLKDLREQSNVVFSKPNVRIEEDKSVWIALLEHSLLASKLISYAQGFMLMKEVSEQREWELNYGNIALMWRGGCIIRSSFLDHIHQAFIDEPDLAFLGLNTHFKDLLEECIPAWRRLVSKSFELGLAMPCMAAALSFFDGLTTKDSSANMIQAQRDYFGAHTYERKDTPRGQFFHTNWTGRGGDTSSSTYNA